MTADLFDPAQLDSMAKALFVEERAIKRLDGWFLIREATEKTMARHPNEPRVVRTALAIAQAVRELPLFISDNNVFAGTQRDAFAKSYALINPNFQVSTFNGYCDPTAVFDDIEPNDEFPKARIEEVRAATQKGEYVSALTKVYQDAENDTAEVAYFVEQVTGHLVPDFRDALQRGLDALIADIDEKLEGETDSGKRDQFKAMRIMLQATLTLAERYAAIAEARAVTATGAGKERYALMAQTLRRVPQKGAGNLYEAIQSFILLWQMMCIEQAPNPFAFSVGNADRIFEPYRRMGNTGREVAAGLFKHFLVFFNVGDRSWAISQNILLGGRGVDGGDLTNETSYPLLDAYFSMNLPQPILSVKLHRNTPDAFYEALGRFFFTPGLLTPSLFNDDAMFTVLKNHGYDQQDLPDYSVAGCQEPLIMGKDNGNTTNSWLNLGKILELALNDGKSAITGRQICRPVRQYASNLEKLQNIRTLFYDTCEYFVSRMAKAANDATEAVSFLPVPFLSCFMGGISSGIDPRDVQRQGTRYNGSGCLIHGLTVVADSFAAIDQLLAERPGDADRLIAALQSDFEGDPELRDYLLHCDKFGNNIAAVDAEAAAIASDISDMVTAQKNNLGNPFRPDWSSPTTHLLYGYWVGATPDGRKARDMLNYGVDPLYGSAENGLGFRTLSAQKLPYDKFNGGYASHLGLDPKYFKAPDFEGKGLEFKNKIVSPLFFPQSDQVPPFYLYLNITTPDTLRKVLANPKKYAPSGVYIMRIHGTFVNFLDLSPDVQQDIIQRLDLQSTAC